MNKFKILCNLLENMKNPKEARGQIADYLKELSPEDQIMACNFMLGKPLENETIGYSKRTVQKVIDTYYDYDKSQKYETLGDMFSGELDIHSNSSVPIYLNTIYKLYNCMSSKTKQKEDILHYVLIPMDDLEKKYFVNILLNKLRVRIGMNVLSWSLAEIYDVDNKYVNNLYKKYESMKDVIEILNGGSDKLIIGVPVKPQLAKDISKHMNRIEYPVLAEPKFDGSRAQIHVSYNKGTGNVWIFSRSLKNKTKGFPDILSILHKNNIQEGIYDAEIYGINPDGSPMAFNKYQHRMNRENVTDDDIDEYPVTIRLFDILMLGDEDYTKELQYTRSTILKQMYPEITTSTKFITCEDELIAYHKECVKAGYEGVMIKNTSGTYDCGRGKSTWGNWFKYKPTQLRCDVVITGATFGTGDNVSLLSSFDIAVLDTDHIVRNIFVDGPEYALKSVGKCGIGFDRATMEVLTERIMSASNNELENYICLNDPIVIEVNPQEITKNESGGIGMRFPTYEGIRSDKGIEDIDTVSMIEQYIE